MPKRTSDVEVTTLRVVIISQDSHLAAVVESAGRKLRREAPGLSLRLHSAAEWADDEARLECCHKDIAAADIIVAAMLFTEEHVEAVRAALESRRDGCSAMLCILSAPPITALTKLGDFDTNSTSGGGLSWLKKLRGDKGDKGKAPGSAGARQMAVLRRLPQLLKFVPGTAQDLRAYLLAMNYWLLGSRANVENLVRLLVNRYAEPTLQKSLTKAAAPINYPDVGLYHPDLADGITEALEELPSRAKRRGVVGLVLMRSYILAENTHHYDQVIAALEARGLDVIPSFASGLDASSAVESYFLSDSGPRVDAVLSLTGFSLIGGPAYNDSDQAVALLKRLNVPYLSAEALEFQSLSSWEESERGLLPLETVMMVAIPELDGAAGTMVYGGRVDTDAGAENGVSARNIAGHGERIDALADRLAKLISLRETRRQDRKVAVVLFNFPPNSGAAGSAAFLSVYESAYNLLGRLAAEGYSVERPDSLEAFKAEILAGNADEHGTEANVVAKVPSEDYMRRTPYLEEIEAQWGPAPGRTLTDGRNLLIQGARFGNVLLAIQPAFGYEGDPMRLLFERNHAPTHAFNAFYQYLRQDFGADAVLHFGTHGALEFMPGKQVGLSERCWPDRLIGDLPNYYLYAANNPSEATIAKRRSNAVIISHLTPPLATSGLYRELADLRALLDRARSLSPDDSERTELVVQAKEQASALEVALPTGADSDDAVLDQLTDELRKLEETLIPLGLHTLEATPSRQRSRDYLALLIQDQHPEANDALIDALLDQAPESTLNTLCNDADGEGALRDALSRFQEIARRLLELDELGAIVHALDGGYLEPVSGGDLLRNPDILPTGRNVHGFDPTKLPSTLAVETGRRQADQLLACHAAKTGKPPEMIAMVLWGTDNLKSEGVPIGQALALIGARPRMDSYGRLAGAELIPLAELGRPRVDVLLTLSGIFRDLLPGQIQLLAEAAHLAAVADEPLAENPIRRHALAHAQANGCPLETSTLRVFSNAGGTYGANVNHLIDSGAWDSDDELGAMFSRRKCFAYSMDAKPVEQEALMTSLLADVDLTFQNLDSIELGVTTVDHYFDSLGGISKAVELARGEGVPTYIGDHTQQESVVRTLAEQLTLESRTRLLNPRWYEEMLSHGQEGVHQLHAHVTNTMGWSATTNQVSPWVYEQLTQTFVLDDVMRERLAELNPTASLKLANRLLEARDRDYWHPDDSVLDALRDAEMALEDRLEGLESLQGATP